MHIAHNCPNAPLEAQLFYFKQLSKDDEDQKSNKKRKVDLKNKEDILKYVENQELTPKRQEQLKNDMCLAFVCAGISFNVAKNKIFHAWLQDLRLGFKIPGSKTLAGRIFNKQIIRVEVKMESEIQNKNYITLGSFYDDLYFMTTVLRPIKESIVQLESRDSTLADCFIYLIKLASTIYQMPQDQHVIFRRHCVNSINRRLLEFNNDIYYLAYFLHPKFKGHGFKRGQYKKISRFAEIFRENGQNNNIRSDSEHVAEEDPNYNYDVDDLVDKVFA
ncbi:hypothetical protein C2G38_2148936 [Gigaspora rosea]|uniref:Uncharacterized protein n=1 Tax=Gigaspora rosea TaxID=44941 RepID=A0A397U318_9GLOM|nr:hypothetical protein C2G38_2148936 [Gigaspora rosea]